MEPGQRIAPSDRSVFNMNSGAAAHNSILGSIRDSVGDYFADIFCDGIGSRKDEENEPGRTDGLFNGLSTFVPSCESIPQQTRKRLVFSHFIRELCETFLFGRGLVDEKRVWAAGREGLTGRLDARTATWCNDCNAEKKTKKTKSRKSLKTKFLPVVFQRFAPP